MSLSSAHYLSFLPGNAHKSVNIWFFSLVEWQSYSTFHSSFKRASDQSHVRHAVISQTKASVDNKLLQVSQGPAGTAAVDAN